MTISKHKQNYLFEEKRCCMKESNIYRRMITLHSFTNERIYIYIQTHFLFLLEYFTKEEIDSFTNKTSLQLSFQAIIRDKYAFIFLRSRGIDKFIIHNKY